MTFATHRIAAMVGTLMLGTSSVLAQAPTTSDTTGRLIADYDKPGIYPTSITASNVNMSPLAGVELDGVGEDLMNVSFPSSSPVRWTSSRANAGDLSLLMGPAYPDNPFSYPDGDASLPYLNNFQAMGGASSGPINPESLDLTTLAWRVSPNKGALLATTRHNGVDNGYTRAGSSGQSTGEYRGLTYFIEGGQGMGFRMTTGEYRNLNDASDLNTGHAGSAGGRHEASFNVATAYLPYEAGWLGAWVGAGSNGAASYFFRPDSVTAISNVNWTNNVASVQLTGIDSADDGMLFVAPTNGDSDMKIASAYPNGSGGWNMTMRADDNANTAGTDILSAKNSFQYAYVPYTATNLVGGHVNATDGTMINGGGMENFTLTRTEKGHFALSVFEEDGVTKKNEDSGMLILSVADTMESNSALGSRAMMSYEYDSVSGDFLIDVVELISTTSTNPGADGYGNEFAGVDDNFYFAWIDFENPMTLTPPTPPVLAGDYNGDGMVNLADYTVWRDNLGGSAEALANNVDGETVDETHYATWKANFGESLPEGTLGTVSSIPEPGSIVMLVVATGIGGMVVRRRQAV